MYIARDYIRKSNDEHIKNTLLNFKPVKDIDLDAIMDYYKIKL